MQPGRVSAKEVNAASDKVLGATVAGASVPGKLVGPVVSPAMTMALEIKNSPNLNSNSNPTSVPQSCVVLPPEAWIHVLSACVTLLFLYLSLFLILHRSFTSLNVLCGCFVMICRMNGS